MEALGLDPDKEIPSEVLGRVMRLKDGKWPSPNRYIDNKSCLFCKSMSMALVNS